jgi:hypothetical protein
MIVAALVITIGYRFAADTFVAQCIGLAVEHQPRWPDLNIFLPASRPTCPRHAQIFIRKTKIPGLIAS